MPQAQQDVACRASVGAVGGGLRLFDQLGGIHFKGLGQLAPRGASRAWVRAGVLTSRASAFCVLELFFCSVKRITLEGREDPNNHALSSLFSTPGPFVLYLLPAG
jgi:hypothetical protein